MRLVAGIPCWYFPSRYFDLSSRKSNDTAGSTKACARFKNLAREIDYAIDSYILRESMMFWGDLELDFSWILSLELVIAHDSITKKLKESLFEPLPPNR